MCPFSSDDRPSVNSATPTIACCRDNEKNLSFMERFDQLDVKLDRLESLLSALTHLSTKKNIDPQYLAWDQAAILLGLNCRSPSKAAKKRVERERERPGGMQLRIIHGGVHRDDFLAWVKVLAQRRPSLREQVQSVIREKI